MQVGTALDNQGERAYCDPSYREESKVSSHRFLQVLAGFCLVVTFVEHNAVGSVGAGPGGTTIVEKHRGFDTCQNISTSTMSAGYSGTAYSVVGFYLGGELIDLACPSHAGFHTTAWINTIYAQGWNFQPIWDGKQSPCITSSFPHSTNSAVAYTQGVDQANAASVAAVARGFSNGTILTMDLEGPISPGCAYAGATKEYVRGWTSQLQAYFWLSGVYSGTCFFNSLATISPPPNEISIAEYNGSANMGIYQVNGCLASAYWTLDQRSHQYLGPHYEAWGGTTVQVDTSCYVERVAGSNAHSTYVPCLS